MCKILDTQNTIPEIFTPQPTMICGQPLSPVVRAAGFLFLILMQASASFGGYEEGLLAYQQKDYATALEEWHPLAEAGHLESQVGLGMLYMGGKGVPKSYPDALKWMKFAAMQGSAFAQFYVGTSLEHGKGTVRDPAAALKWYRRSADQGLAEAQARLGHLFLNGVGVPQDYGESLKWFQLAADQGLAEAYAKLGVIHGLGLGTPKDIVLSHMWFNLAAASGQSDAAEARDAASKLMSSEQIAKAQRLAREWKPRNQPQTSP